VDRWAKVIQVRLVPPLTYIIRFQNGEKIGPWKSEAAADDVAKVINAAIESHPRMKQLLEIEKAANEYVKERENIAPDVTMRKVRFDALKAALSAYASAKENRG
jgi:hypothetical protein